MDEIEKKDTIISIFSVSNRNYQDILYVHLNSIKQNKSKNTKINYYALVEGCFDKIEHYYSDLIAPDFNLIFIDPKKWQDCVGNKKDYMYYIRCLAPFIFNDLDKILFLDVDTIITNNRLDELWAIDIENKYLAATIDIEESFWDRNERINVGKDYTGNNYFNAGVMLLNLKKIREDGYVKKLADSVASYPKNLISILRDQTLLNWIFKDNIKLISTDFNNSILSMSNQVRYYYENYYKTKNLVPIIKNACILHFKGPKVWDFVEKQKKKERPFFELAKFMYYDYYSRLSKQKFNVKIIQYFVGTNKKYIELCHEVEKLNKTYAELYGYSYNFNYIDETIVKDYFGQCTYKEMLAYKIKYMYDSLLKNDCDILVFIDADAAVSKPTIKIEELIDNEHDLFLSKGNDVVAVKNCLNNIKIGLKNVYSNETVLYENNWHDIIKNNIKFYEGMERMSIGCVLHNEGFYIIRNTNKMKELFKDALTIESLLMDTLYSGGPEEGRCLSLCLLKKKYFDSFAFLYSHAQNARASSFPYTYDEEQTFILHEYGDATTKEQKINGVKTIWNNKWWKNALNSK